MVKLANLEVWNCLISLEFHEPNRLRFFRSTYKLPVCGGDPLEGSRPRSIGSPKWPQKWAKGSKLGLKWTSFWEANSREHAWNLEVQNTLNWTISETLLDHMRSGWDRDVTLRPFKWSKIDPEVSNMGQKWVKFGVYPEIDQFETLKSPKSGAFRGLRVPLRFRFS